MRIARPQRRASTVVFSKRAIIRNIKGAWWATPYFFPAAAELMVSWPT